MCGIACVVSHPSQTPGEPNATALWKQLDASLDLIAHRGPDARGCWVDKNGQVGFAHCRLSINDLRPSATQPLHSASNDIHVVVNGEVYDFDRLKASLSEQFGYHFRTQSDSEVVLALYEHYGVEFLNQIRGEFAICIYDERSKLFIAARDRYGIKPLFWTLHDGRLLVAAEIKAFLGLGWQPEWDVASIVEAGWNFDNRTLFKDVQKLEPGYYLTFDKDGILKTEMYWDIEYPDKLRVEPRTEAEMIDGVKELMMDAIRVRLRADVPVGIYLSGGIDSSAIAGMIAHLVNNEGVRIGSSGLEDRICCFSIAFDKDSGFDESDVAERTAKWLNVRFLKQLMTEEELAKRFEDATWHCEHHNHDLNYVGKFALSELPRKHGYKVVLTGEGADENFGGYRLYQPDFLSEPDYAYIDNGMTDPERKRLKAETKRSVANGYNAIGANGADRPSRVANDTIGDLSTPNYMSAFHFDGFAAWTGQEYKQDPVNTIGRAIPKHARALIRERWHPLHSALYVWSKGHLVNNFLSCLGDRTEMSHSIEARPPYLDHMFTAYVNSIPPSLKIRYDPATSKFVEKWILREAARPFITDELYQREKQAYTAPTKWPKDGPLHQLFQRLLTEKNVRNLGFVDWERAKHLVNNAFCEGEAKSLRDCLQVGQWVVLSQRFKIHTAQPRNVQADGSH